MRTVFRLVWYGLDDGNRFELHHALTTILIHTHVSIQPSQLGMLTQLSSWLDLRSNLICDSIPTEVAAISASSSGDFYLEDGVSHPTQLFDPAESIP